METIKGKERQNGDNQRLEKEDLKKIKCLGRAGWSNHRFGNTDWRQSEAMEDSLVRKDS